MRRLAWASRTSRAQRRQLVLSINQPAGASPPAGPPGCPISDDVAVEVRRDGRRFEAEAVLDLAADTQTVWDTITDYGALSRFMPGFRACRVIAQAELVTPVRRRRRTHP